MRFLLMNVIKKSLCIMEFPVKEKYLMLEHARILSEQMRT